MVWLKRALPLVVLLALWWGYRWLQQSQQVKVLAQTHQAASVTAQLWFASARYRDEPERYAAFRDSLLKANNLSREALTALVSKYDSDPDWSRIYSNEIKNHVDSLFQIEDSLLKASGKKPALPSADSLKIMSERQLLLPKRPTDTLTRSGTRSGNVPVHR